MFFRMWENVDSLHNYSAVRILAFSLVWRKETKLKLFHNKIWMCGSKSKKNQIKAQIKRSHHGCPCQNRTFRIFACRCKWPCYRMDSDGLRLCRIQHRMGYNSTGNTWEEETSYSGLQSWAFLCVGFVYVLFSLVFTQKLQVQHTRARSSDLLSVRSWWSRFAGSGGTEFALEHHGVQETLLHVSLKKNTHKRNFEMSTVTYKEAVCKMCIFENGYYIEKGPLLCSFLLFFISPACTQRPHWRNLTRFSSQTPERV